MAEIHDNTEETSTDEADTMIEAELVTVEVETTVNIEVEVEATTVQASVDEHFEEDSEVVNKNDVNEHQKVCSEEELNKAMEDKPENPAENLHRQNLNRESSNKSPIRWQSLNELPDSTFETEGLSDDDASKK